MAKIIVIDDEEFVRSTMRQFLVREGHSVMEAADGMIGWQLACIDKADLVITDIIMPEMEGIETIMKLQADLPAVKIIAISGGGRKGNLDFLQAAKSLGASVILSKPFSRQQLIDAVNACLVGN